MQVARLVALFRWNRSHLLRLAGVLFAVRATVHLRLFPGLPDLTPAFRQDPYLTLLDVFSGGALGRGSVLALGVYPLVLARPVAALLSPARDALERRRFYQTWRRITALFSLVLGWSYPVFLERVAGVALSGPRLWGALALAAGTTLVLWFGFLLNEESPESGLKLLVAFQVLAALPGYLFAGCSTLAEGTARALAVIAAAVIYCILSLGGRGIPVQDAKPRELRRSVAAAIQLAAFGLLQRLLLFLSRSQVGALRELAAGGLRLVDLSAPGGWWSLFLVGFLIEWVVNWSWLSGGDMADQARKSGYFVPGLRPGRTTASYIDRVLARIAWIGPLVTVGLPVAVALATLRLQPESRWPVLTVPLLFTVLPLQGLELFWRSEWSRFGAGEDFIAFIKRQRGPWR